MGVLVASMLSFSLDQKKTHPDLMKRTTHCSESLPSQGMSWDCFLWEKVSVFYIWKDFCWQRGGLLQRLLIASLMTFLHFFLTNKTPFVVGDALCLLERKLHLSVFREENGGPVTKF